MIWWLIGIGAVVGLIVAIFDGDCYFLGAFFNVCSKKS